MATDPVFDIDEFNKPAQYSGPDADILNLYRIIKGRDNSHVTNGIGFNIEQYRFEEIISSKTDIETRLRNHITEVSPEIYLDSINLNVIDRKTLFFIINVIKQQSGMRDTIFFKITNKDNTHLLVELINNK